MIEQGMPTRFVWRCRDCDARGVEASIPAVRAAMNGHTAAHDAGLAYRRRWSGHRIAALGLAVCATGLAICAVLAGWPAVVALTAAVIAVGVLIAEAGRPWITPDPDPRPSRLDRLDGLR